MLTRLIASRAEHDHSIGAATITVVFHATLLVLAIRFAAPATVMKPLVVEQESIIMPPDPAPVVRPTGPRIAHRCDPCAPPVLPTPSILLDVDVQVAGSPSVGSIIVEDPFPRSGSGPSAHAECLADCRPVPLIDDAPARPLPGNPRPVYPELLRGTGIEGSVTADFVIDSAGRVVAESIRFEKSDAHELFAAAARRALLVSRYEPARAGGRPVAMRVTQTFTFRMRD